MERKYRLFSKLFWRSLRCKLPRGKLQEYYEDIKQEIAYAFEVYRRDDGSEDVNYKGISRFVSNYVYVLIKSFGFHPRKVRGRIVYEKVEIPFSDLFNSRKKEILGENDEEE